jgi:hypothetical protein
MAYTIRDEYGYCKPLWMLGEVNGAVELYQRAPEDTEWIGDPCAHSSMRFEITWPSGCVEHRAWYQVVCWDDSYTDIRCKMQHYQNVLTARESLRQAENEYKRLTHDGACMAGLTDAVIKARNDAFMVARRAEYGY